MLLKIYAFFFCFEVSSWFCFIGFMLLQSPVVTFIAALLWDLQFRMIVGPSWLHHSWLCDCISPDVTRHSQMLSGKPFYITLKGLLSFFKHFWQLHESASLDLLEERSPLLGPVFGWPKLRVLMAAYRHLKKLIEIFFPVNQLAIIFLACLSTRYLFWMQSLCCKTPVPHLVF